jgi:hypothetical protein
MRIGFGLNQRLDRIARGRTTAGRLVRIASRVGTASASIGPFIAKRTVRLIIV